MIFSEWIRDVINVMLKKNFNWLKISCSDCHMFSTAFITSKSTPIRIEFCVRSSHIQSMLYISRIMSRTCINFLLHSFNQSKTSLYDFTKRLFVGESRNAMKSEKETSTDEKIQHLLPLAASFILGCRVVIGAN